MSVVVCKVYEDRIELAADSILTSGDSKRCDCGTPKLVEIHGYYLGHSGLASDLVSLEIYLASNKPKAPTRDAVFEWLSDFVSNRNDDSPFESAVLLAFDGKVFSAERMFVHEVVNYKAIGCGRDWANAALHLGHTPVEAVEATCALCVYCDLPVVTYTLSRQARPPKRRRTYYQAVKEWVR